MFQQVNGDAKPSVVSKAIQSENPYEKEVIVKSATQMVTGGADTVSLAYELGARLFHPCLFSSLDRFRNFDIHLGHGPSSRYSEESASRD